MVLVAQLAIVAAAITLLALRFVIIDAGSHSASDTLRPWLVEVAVVSAVAAVLVVAIGQVSRLSR